MVVGPTENPDENRIEKKDEHEGAEMQAKSVREARENIELPQHLIENGKEVQRNTDPVEIAKVRVTEIETDMPDPSKIKTTYLDGLQQRTELAKNARKAQGYVALENVEEGNMETLGV